MKTKTTRTKECPSNRTHSFYCGTLWQLAALLLSLPMVHAATLTWDNSGANPSAPTDGFSSLWDTTSTVWSDGSVDAAWLNGNNDIAVFGSNNGIAGTVNLGAAITAGGLIFNPATSGNYTIAGGTGPFALTLAGATPTITANVNASISAIIAGANGLTKDGNGTLYLTGVNTYTGGTVINNGILSVAANTSLGGAGSITIKNGATFQYSGGTGGFTRAWVLDAGTTTLEATGGGLNSTGAFSFIGSGARTLVLSGSSTGSILGGLLSNGTGGATSLQKSGTGTWQLNRVNTYTGVTTISAGILRTGIDNAIPVAGTVYIAKTATLSLNANQRIANLQDGDGGGGTITTAFGDNTFRVLTVESGSFSGIMRNAGTLRFLQLVKATGGTLTLSGANTYTGGTDVQEGTLVLAATNTLQSATGTLTVSGGTLASSVANAVIGGNVMLNSGFISANGTGVGALSLATGKDFTMAGGTIEFTLGASYDQIFGTGNFSITGGTFALDITGGGFDYGTSYDLFSGFGNGAVSGLSITGYDTANWLATLDTDGTLTFTAVPEPGTYALLFFGGCALLVIQGYRRRKTIGA